MSYSYYPSSPGSAMQHIGRPALDDGRGSFGPVLAVMAVISFLSVAACVAGRVCGRGSSPTGKFPGQHQGEEAEKGLGASHLAAVMRPVPSSRATVHDVDDAFEINILPAEAGGAIAQAPPPRQCVAAAVGTAGLRGPGASAGNGGVVRPAHHPPSVRSGVRACRPL